MSYVDPIDADIALALLETLFDNCQSQKAKVTVRVSH
jgi:hypothetical protein